ncbi:hypothetical protein [Natronincola ferrireducens]|uniref:Uncharacterized protein n=1 Tax=Natronincola ferrireducens TaxID=393762 RepID=A0A1G9I3U4_9FIRM|nr:hypothetical protein [Natronincola ferrireducens]SDL19879.1 hypothetical protein SAMN05660472_02790 [Natronincola ferrireducens]
MKSSKKEKIEIQINEFIKSVLNMAESEGKLDHINIEISNHNGNLQMDYTLRDRKKAY